ncbi:hypothetical protein C2W64_02817 [Brevibacillus laterosporus]|nr:hypothetical protein C2W64_02817 [Brevibacillus laterosporus]
MKMNPKYINDRLYTYAKEPPHPQTNLQTRRLHLLDFLPEEMK